MNLAELLATSAKRHGPQPAVTDVRSGRSLSYGELALEADRVAAFLAAQGVEPGQRIGLVAANGLAYLPAAFGLLASGACLVPLATNLTPSEVSRILRDVDVNGCLASPGTEPLIGSAAGRATIPHGACAGFTFQWTSRDVQGAPGLRQLNPAFIRFTSGTTASSKGVVLSHEATAARIAAADQVLKLSEADRILWVLPLAYHFAVTIVAYVKAGAHVLMCPDTLPGALVDAIERFRATVLYASPLHFERLGSLPSVPLPSVRLALSTSAPITTAVMDRFESVYGVPVGQAYGIIEAGLPCINVRQDGPPSASVGRPVPGYDVAVFSDEGLRLPAGVPGEIGVRGAGLFSAYYAPWLLREHLTREGWFMTGDIGWLDGAGALHLKGRKKAVIFVAGLKFFPEEVEECINDFSGVKESRVFGRPHPHLGEVPCAEVVLAPGGDLAALKAHCTGALSSYKVPVEFTVVEAIPRTPGGKILRRSTTVER
ncbi:MAG: class I adenylate-forming enzyme family protein [Candidatus Rokuibacteriota bacterium]